MVPAANIVPVPRGWSLEETAGAPLVFLTAWQALTQWSNPPAPPPAGSVLLVTGASGGVGTASLLLGKSMNLTVLALVSQRQSRREVEGTGGRLRVRTRTSRTCIRRSGRRLRRGPWTLPWTPSAGPLFNEVVKTLGHGGRISVVGRAGGAVPEFNTASLFFRTESHRRSFGRRLFTGGGASSLAADRRSPGCAGKAAGRGQCFPIRASRGGLHAIGARTTGKGAGAGGGLSVYGVMQVHRAC